MVILFMYMFIYRVGLNGPLMGYNMEYFHGMEL